MRICVTGHLGYIGSLLIPMLLDRGHEVCGIDTDLYRRCTFGDPSGIRPIPTLERDIRDVQVADLTGYDAVIHLAALSNDPLGNMRPELTDQINHLAAVRLAQIAKDAGVGRFVFSSTCSNYGAAGEEFLDEDSGFNPQTPYGVAKVAAEKGIRALASDSFTPVILRSGTVCGMSPRIRFDLVLNNLMAWALTTGKVHLKSDGMAWRPIVHVEDVCRAFVAVTEADQDPVHDRAFNVGRTDQNFRVRELATLVHETVEGSEIAFGEGAGRDTRNYRVNCDRIREQLPEFEPQWTIEKAAVELHDAFQRFGVTLEDFEGPRFQRLKHIQSLQSGGLLDLDLRWNHAPSTAFADRARSMRCRCCGQQNLRPVLDLGAMPRSDGLIDPDKADRPEPRSPLELAFCESCALAQITETLPAESLFGDEYLYFSSYSKDLLAHSAINAGELIERFGLDGSDLVVELASNDGYMLKNFVDRGIPVLGIDPAPRQARAANEHGVRTLCEFFSTALAENLVDQGQRADVIIANNVLAHVTDTHDFIAGMKTLMKEDGCLVIEVPSVAELIDHHEFDTIYHEHLCYFSVHSLVAMFARHGLHINDIKHLPIHGGSMRLFVQNHEAVSDAVLDALESERACGVGTLAYYSGFAAQVQSLCNSMRTMITDLRAQGKSIAAYGAAAKGTILLNAMGIGADLLDRVYDKNPHKHGQLMPGVRLAVGSVEELRASPPDYLLILPWNFKDEIMAQEQAYHNAGGRFIVPIPEPTIV